MHNCNIMLFQKSELWLEIGMTCTLIIYYKKKKRMKGEKLVKVGWTFSPSSMRRHVFPVAAIF